MADNIEDSKADIAYRVAFNAIPGIGRVRFNQLENHFQNLEAAWNAGPGELRQAGLDKNSVKAITDWRPRISPETEIQKLKRFGIKAITYYSPDFPARLKEIYDYPPLFFMKGSIIAEDEWCLAVVGTRNPSAYGRQVTEEIVTGLVRSKITIVSGLARGIDTVAHRAALEAGGRTIAVTGGGLDSIYPAENTAMADSISKNGAVISEYNPGIKPRPENFPRRNRILSGLSMGVLVIEAGKASGALITAHLALEQNREVFAVPGSILSPASRGTNQLIKEGAKLVSDYTDILEELNLTSVAEQLEMKEIIPSSDSEAMLLKKLGAEPIHIDEICRASSMSTAAVSSTLAMMELKGMIKQVGAMNYCLCREAREKYTVEID